MTRCLDYTAERDLPDVDYMQPRFMQGFFAYVFARPYAVGLFTRHPVYSSGLPSERMLMKPIRGFIVAAERGRPGRLGRDSRPDIRRSRDRSALSPGETGRPIG